MTQLMPKPMLSVVDGLPVGHIWLGEEKPIGGLGEAWLRC